MSLAQTGTPPAVAVSAPLNPESLALARRLMEFTYPLAQRPVLFAGPARAITEQTRQAAMAGITDAGLRALIEKSVQAIPPRLQPITAKNIPALVDGYARAYARAFKVEELRQIVAFAQTPAGTHYLAPGAFLIADPDVVAANRAYGEEMKAAQQQAIAELIRDGRAYIAQHPEAAPQPRGAAPAPPPAAAKK
jgi:hypothetical protein